MKHIYLNELNFIIKQKLELILSQKNLVPIELKLDTKMTDLGLDSMEIVSLVAFLDEILGGDLMEFDFKFEDFISLSSISILLQKVLSNRMNTNQKMGKP